MNKQQITVLVFAIANGFFLSACGEGTEEPDRQQLPPVTLELQQWTGIWASDNGEDTGFMDVLFGENLTVSGNILNSFCGNQFSGSYFYEPSDGDMTGIVSANGGQWNFTGVATDDTIAGTYLVTGGPCDGDTGTFNLSFQSDMSPQEVVSELPDAPGGPVEKIDELWVETRVMTEDGKAGTAVLWIAQD